MSGDDEECRVEGGYSLCRGLGTGSQARYKCRDYVLERPLALYALRADQVYL